MAVKVGTIIEIETSKGLAYAQYTHQHADYGYLVRVIEGFYQSTPHDLSALANKSTSFMTFFPLGAAIKRKIVKIVGSIPIPEFAKEFPIFKTGYFDEKQRKISVWFLWDGEKEWRVDSLTEKEKDYPVRGIVNDTLLIERIESDWKSRDWDQ